MSGHRLCPKRRFLDGKRFSVMYRNAQKPHLEIGERWRFNSLIHLGRGHGSSLAPGFRPSQLRQRRPRGFFRALDRPWRQRGGNAWLFAHRVQRAKRLLNTTALPVSEVSFAVGYEDPGYFTRPFRKYVGETPLRYRSRHSKAAIRSDQQ